MRKSFYKFMEGKRLRDSYRQQSYVVRIFHPRGQYPRTKIMQRDALFWADDEMVFSVTHSVPWRVHDEDGPYTEMDWLAPDEIQFLGSIFFSERRNNAHIRFYPVFGYGPRIAQKELDLSRSVSITLRHQVA